MSFQVHIFNGTYKVLHNLSSICFSRFLSVLSPAIFSFLVPSPWCPVTPSAFTHYPALVPQSSCYFPHLKCLSDIVSAYSSHRILQFIRWWKFIKREGWPSSPNCVTDKPYVFGKVTSSLSDCFLHYKMKGEVKCH